MNGSGAALIANYKENLKGIVLNEIQEKMTVEGFCHWKNPLLLDTVAMNYNLPVYHNKMRCYIYSHTK